MPVYLCFNLFGIYQSEEITSIICEMGGALNVDCDVAVCLAVLLIMHYKLNPLWLLTHFSLIVTEATLFIKTRSDLFLQSTSTLHFIFYYLFF